MNAIYLFTLRGIPVFVQPWFFLLLAFFAFGSDLTSGLIFAVCVTFSLLVHEFGHATVAAYYQLQPAVILHGWGGLCAHQRAKRDLHDAFIVSAGPGAGFALGIACILLQIVLPESFLSTRPLVQFALFQLIFINIFWSLFNILPLWPLDGGQLFRLAVLRFTKPATAERIVHIVGIGMAIACALMGWLLIPGAGFMVLVCALLGYENFKRLRSSSASGPIRTRDRLSNSLLDQAHKELDTGNYREAARLGHQVRAQKNLSDKQDRLAWEVIALGTLLDGRIDEGLRFAEHAPSTPRLIAARINALLLTNQVEEARALSRTKEFRKLPAAVRQELVRRFDLLSAADQ